MLVHKTRSVRSVLKCLVKHYTYSKVITKFVQYFVGLHTVSYKHFHVNNNNNNNNLLAHSGYKDYKFSTLFLQFVEATYFWFVLIQLFRFSDFLLPLCLSWWYKVFNFAGYTCKGPITAA